MSRAALDWDRDGADWPNQRASRFVESGGLRWHVQRVPCSAPAAPRARTQAPLVLLLHGTGASTHSWRDLMPRLATSFEVLALDLPGHAFTDAPRPARQSLDGMADAVGNLLHTLQVSPAVIVGHSAGAAVAARLCLDGEAAPRALVSLNGALLPWRGVPAVVFPPLARLLALNPLVPAMFAWRAGDPSAMRRLIESTGSRLDDRGMTLYARVVQSRAHVSATLAMMAHWDLQGLQRDLPRLAPELTLVTGTHDRAVPTVEAERVQSLLPAARIVRLPGLGHLAHEEAPVPVADIVIDAARRAGVTSGANAVRVAADAGMAA